MGYIMAHAFPFVKPFVRCLKEYYMVREQQNAILLGNQFLCHREALPDCVPKYNQKA
jgi:hypothetical protein